MTIIGKPEASEYGEFFAGYVSKVDSENIIEYLDHQVEDLQQTLDGLSNAQASDIHSPYTWSLKQLMGHLIDGEKVFGYRLHRFACNDSTPLPGFDHEPYVDNLDYSNVLLSALVDEWSNLRKSNVLFLQRLPEGASQRKGTASDTEFTVRSQAFVIGGHVQHHLEIMKKRLADA